MSNDKKIVGFKKFSEFKSESKIEEVDASLPISPEDDSDRPMLPNLPKPTTKVEKPISRKSILPKQEDVEEEFSDDSVEATKENVKTYGKVAKFPKSVKASSAYNFLENINTSKKSIWYIMVEKDQELQMIKYNYKEGVDLSKFINELKTYYISKNKSNKFICESVSKITIDGNDKYSMIKNIPPIEIDGKKIITRLTEDLIKLLSK